MEFFKLMLWLTSYFLFKFVLFLVPLLLTIAFFTLLERKFMAAIQRRIGPNIIGFFGLLQPLADGLKLFLKESIIPTRANIFLFLLVSLWLFCEYLRVELKIQSRLYHQILTYIIIIIKY